MNILAFLGFTKSEEANLGDLHRALEGVLSDHSEQDLKYITGLSGLLGKVAHSDGEISEEEQLKIRTILSDSLGLPLQQINEVLGLLTKHTVELSGVQDYRYSRMLFECLPEKEKRLAVLEALFLIAAVDGEITFEEDKVIGTIATGLKLTRQDFIQSRLPFSQHLAVIKNLPKD